MLILTSLIPLFLALGAARLIPSVRVIGELEPGVFLENIAVRSNGDILSTTLFPNASVYSLSKPASKHRSLDLLASVPSVHGLLGMAEVNVAGEEAFVVVGGNISSFDGISPPIFEAGSFSAWTITFGSQVPKITKVSDLSPTSQFLNGVCAIPWLPHIVLIADSRLSTVGRLNISTGVYEPFAFYFPQMAIPPGAFFGVNGIKVSNSYLYWANSGLQAVFRVSITPEGYSAEGSVPELVASNMSKTYIDDFTIAANTGILAVTNSDNSLVYANPATGRSKTILSGLNYPAINGATALSFGRGFADCGTIYVVTANTEANNQTQNGRIVAFEAKGIIPRL